MAKGKGEVTLCLLCYPRGVSELLVRQEHRRGEWLFL